jgi:hypothetical protein
LTFGTSRTAGTGCILPSRKWTDGISHLKIPKDPLAIEPGTSLGVVR